MAEWISNLVDSMGYTGIALLMLLENIVPPIPSEVVMPSAGYTARQGDLNFWGVIIAGTIGTLLGALPYYFVARWLGEGRFRRFVQRHGKWLTITVKEYDRSIHWFDRWGTWAVTLGRLVPTVRTLISVPAGLAKMNFSRFILWSAVGTVCWNLLLASLGWFLRDQFRWAADVVGWIGMAVIVLAVLYYIYRLLTHREPSSA